MKALKWWRDFLSDKLASNSPIDSDNDIPIDELVTKSEDWRDVTNTELFKINDLVNKHIFGGKGSDLRWYSIKIEDAWLIVDKLTEKNNNWRIELYQDHDQVYVDIENGDSNAPWKNSEDDPYVCAHSGDIMKKQGINKMPLAICIAALRAKGVEVEREELVSED